MGGVLKRFGIAFVFSAAAHYCLHLLEPLANDTAPSGQRLPPPYEAPVPPQAYLPQPIRPAYAEEIPWERSLEERLREAVYVP